MHCLLEELHDLSILPYGWVMLRRMPNTDPGDEFIEIKYFGGNDLLKRNRKLEAVVEAGKELQEVADLRGDNILPHPEDDPGLWTARMQTAWDELRDNIADLEEGK